MKPDRTHEPYEDPLIDEVRERRRKLLDEHDNDLAKLFETIRKIQDEHPEKMIRKTAGGVRHRNGN